MTDDLARFLQMEELDDAQRLAQRLTPLSGADTRAVDQILDAWDDPQAVANLLMHPNLIPREQRRAALLRGLLEPLTYTTLAAIVGLQSQSTIWPDADRTLIAQRLHTIIHEARPVLADRASVTLLAYARPADADRLIFLLSYPGEIVQHNALVALIRLLGGEATRARVEAALADRRVTESGQAFVTAHFDSLLHEDLPALSYIPNRMDFSG